jgi:hypothetical protein
MDATTEDENAVLAFYTKYRAAMDARLPLNTAQAGGANGAPSSEAGAAEDAPASKPSGTSGASRVKEYLAAKREAEAQAATAIQRKRAKVVKSAGGILVSKELNKTSFPASGIKWSTDWDSRVADGPLLIDMDDFALDQNQTLVMRLTVPQDSTTWALSICPNQHEEFMNVLFHFNPRQRERGGTLVQNERVSSRWSAAERTPLEYFAPLFGRTFDLAVQVNEDGFHTAIDTKYAATFMHRSPIDSWSRTGPLVLEVPHTDDYGNPETLIVHQIWWGKKPAIPGLPKKDEYLAPVGEVTAPTGLQGETSIHVSGLPGTPEDGDATAHEAAVKEELQDMFAPYGVVSIKMFLERGGYGFVNIRDPVKASEALQMLDGTKLLGSKISLSRARGR